METIYIETTVVSYLVAGIPFSPRISNSPSNDGSTSGGLIFA